MSNQTPPMPDNEPTIKIDGRIKGIEVLNHDKKQTYWYDDMENVSDGYHTFKELYEFRLLYNSLLFNEWANLPANPYLVHKSHSHSDGEPAFGGGWFVVSALLPTGQITNHYEDKDWGLFQIPTQSAADTWDGHTPADVAKRLRETLSNPTSPVQREEPML